MSDDALEVAVLESWLIQSDLSWLEEVACSSIPEDGIGRAQADQMLRLHALYQAIRAEFPNLKFSRAVLVAFMGPDSARDMSMLDGPLRAGTWWSGWYGSPEDVMGAAALGREGSLEAVLVAGDLLCHGFNGYGGDGRALIESYRHFLPAIASYTSATTGVRFADIQAGPGWYYPDGYPNRPSKPNTLTRAINRSLTSQQRRALVALVARGDNAECAWASDYGIVATALGLDTSFLTADEMADVEQITEDYVFALLSSEPVEAPHVTIEDGLEPLHLACVVGAHLDQLIEDATDVPSSDTEARAQLVEQHRWIADWGQKSWRYAKCWPEGPLREAIERSPWDWFEGGMPPR